MRWYILSLLFVATTINYFDRAILGLLLPEIRAQIHINDHTYGLITFSFQIAYALGSLIGGRLLDKYGTRIGFGVAAALWSAAATLNALAASAMQFGLLRVMLGFGEAANFPACNKVSAELFPPRQRAMVMGVVHFAANVANVFGPPIFYWIALTLGWRNCFAIIGGIGFLWVPVWLSSYKLSARPVDSEPKDLQLSIKAVLRYKQAWGYAWAKFLTDPVWWFYLFWIPIYLNDVRHLTAPERAKALMVIYAISGVGAMLGGLSGNLIKRGWSVGRARKTIMLVCACVMPLMALGVLAKTAAVTVVLFGISMAFHAAWMTNLFTTPADVFPKQAVGAANGFGVCIGALGGALFSGIIPGYVIPVAGFIPVLLTMSCFYLLAWILLHRLMGNLEPIEELQDKAIGVA